MSARCPAMWNRRRRRALRLRDVSPLGIMPFPPAIHRRLSARVRTPTTSRFISDRISLQLRLALLVAGTMLPLIVFAAGLVYHEYVRAREEAFERVLETVRGMRHVLDSEMLAPSPRRCRCSRFRRRCRPTTSRASAATSTPSSASIRKMSRSHSRTATDASSSTRGATRPAAAATHQSRDPGPRLSHRRARLFAAHQRLGVGPSDRYRGRPGFRNGEVVYDVAFAPALITFQRIIAQQRPSVEWTVSIFDQTGVNFARLPNPEETTGRRASPTLLAELFKQPEAKLITTSLEGVELITAFTRSPVTGWTVPGACRRRPLPPRSGAGSQ